MVAASLKNSTLGTVLLATLSHLSKATGADKALKSRLRRGIDYGDDPLRYMGTPKNQEDVGEALSRAGEALDVFQRSNTQKTPGPVLENTMVTALRETSVSTVSDPGKKKNKKKRKNAIDDIFNGLL